MRFSASFPLGLACELVALAQAPLLPLFNILVIALSHNQTGIIFQRSAFNFVVSGEEADVAVHIGAQVVQIQRRRTAVRSVVVAAAPDRHTPMAHSRRKYNL